MELTILIDADLCPTMYVYIKQYKRKTMHKTLKILNKLIQQIFHSFIKNMIHPH